MLRDMTSLHGTRAHARLPAALFAVLIVVCAVSLVAPPAGRMSFLLEVVPGMAYAGVLAALFARFPMSHLVYVGLFVHVLILVYGGLYTYAETPFGFVLRDALGLARNPWDRIGHLALGLFPAFTTREVLLRAVPVRRGPWLFGLTCAVILAIGAFWELLEWWTALLVAPDVGTAFLGTQGDEWDAQWDMFLALVGAVVSLVLGARAHERSMARMAERCAPDAQSDDGGPR